MGGCILSGMGATAVSIGIEEYLRTSFDGPDAEYVDGEIVERPMPKSSHSFAQQILAERFGPLRAQNGVFAVPELRVLVADRVVRVPDYCAFRSRPPEEIPSQPPLLVVEIVSPSDSHSALMTKLAEYRAWGAENIWVIDPDLARLSVYRDGDLLQVETLALPEFGVALAAADLFA
jgi:Uma2 family endonuclease